MGGKRSLGEWVVLALLAEAPAHPFALARQLGAGGPLGRVYTVPRPLVYRAVDRLTADGSIEPDRIEPGESGPERTVYRITETGRTSLDGWLKEPVGHIRDLRLAFLLKVVLLRRSGRSPGRLIAAQRAALAETLEGLRRSDDGFDEIDLWRRHNAGAAGSFLDDLARRFPPD